MRLGDHVVVTGPGPIGLMAMMLAKANGAADVTVVGLDADRSRLKIASEIGAQTVNVSTQNLKEKVLSLTDGRGADVIYECAGGNKAFVQAVDVARKGAEVVIVGGGSPGEFDQNQIMIKELTVLGSFGRLPATWDRALSLVVSKAIDLRPIMSHVWPLDKAKDAFRLLLERKAEKIVLTPG